MQDALMLLFTVVFFGRGVSLRQGLPEVEVAHAILTSSPRSPLILSVLLLGYLTLTLLFPEKF